MKIIDIKYNPQIIKTNGKNPFVVDGITFYPDTIVSYKGGYILPIININKKLGNIFQDIGNYVTSAGKWVTGATSDISDFLKNSGLVDIATDVTGLIKAYNEITGSNVSINNLTSSQQKQLQQTINTKTNTTGQYTQSQLNEIAGILGGNNNDINKYLPYIIGGGLFLILLVLILKR